MNAEEEWRNLVMPKIDLVKAIVRYRTSVNRTQPFLYGTGKTENSTRYLLLQKAEDANPENIGKWECSGGLIDPGETSRQAIEKEVKEETSLKPDLEFRIVKQLPTITMKDKEYDSHCDVYLIDTASMDVKLDPKEHSDYRWVKAEDVKNQDLVLYAGLLLEFFNNPKKYLD